MHLVELNHQAYCFTQYLGVRLKILLEPDADTRVNKRKNSVSQGITTLNAIA